MILMLRASTCLAISCLLVQGAVAGAQTSSPAATQEDATAGTTTASTTDPNAAIIAAANAAKAVAEAQQAAATAQKLNYDAQAAASAAKVAADTAKHGTVSGSSFATGAVTVGDAGPQAEATLLVAKAMRDAAVRAAQDLKPAMAILGGRPILIITEAGQASTTQLVIFDLQTDRLLAGLSATHHAFLNVSQYQPPKPATAETRMATARMFPIAAAATVDTALSIAGKLGSYFQTDYKYGAVQVTTVEASYAAALVHALRENGAASFTITSPDDLVPSGVTVLAKLQKIDAAVQQAVDDAARATGAASRYMAQASEDKAHADELKLAGQRLTSSAVTSQAMIDAANSLMTGYFASSADKAAPIGILIQQERTREMLDQKAVLLLVTGTPVAAYYTRKNLWTFFGGIPIDTMGGTTMTYKLYDPVAGQIYAWNSVLQHGGYHSVSAVEGSLRPAGAVGAK